MSGGPIDLTPFGSVLTGLGILYWLVAAGAVFAALKLPKTRRGKSIAAVVVVAVFGYMPASIGWQAFQARSRLNAAMNQFDLRCKRAGEKINRRIVDVEGIFLLRPRLTPINFSNQYVLDDPYGYAGTGDDYVRLFLRGRPTKSVPIGERANANDLIRYRFVELEA